MGTKKHFFDPNFSGHLRIYRTELPKPLKAPQQKSAVDPPAKRII